LLVLNRKRKEGKKKTKEGEVEEKKNSKK